MSTSTDLPIHDVILKIMYNADRDKPIGLSAGDVLWKIDNPEITERYVREVLDWLVREKKAELYLDKYSLDRLEFLEQKAKSEEEEEEDLLLGTGKESFYIKPSKKKIKNLRSRILFFIGVLALCCLTYLYTKLERDYEITTKEIIPNTIVEKQKPVKKLFLSRDKEIDMDKRMEDVSYLFSRQNINNNNMQQEIARLYKLTDSLQKQQHSRFNIIQNQLNKSINENIRYTNEILHKIILCNIVFMSVIGFTFFKGKI